MFMVIIIYLCNMTCHNKRSYGQFKNMCSVLNIFSQNLISQNFAKIALPIFITISDFLFFKNISIKSYREKILKRFIPQITYIIIVYNVNYNLND